MPAHVTKVPCHSISGLRQSYYYMSSVTFCLIIGAFLATLCVHDILPFTFMFSSFSYFISYLCFMNTSIHIAFPIFVLFHACCIWQFIYLYGMKPMYTHIIHVFLFLYESTLLRNWNHSIESSKLKLWHFHAN